MAGVTVYIRAAAARIFADVDVIFGDEPALKEMLDCKGHAGHKSCCLCSNMILHSSMQLYGFPAPMKSMACVEWNEVILHPDASIKHCVARVKYLHEQRQAGRITLDEFTNRSGLVGWNFNPQHEELFGDHLNLRVASCLMWDWAHIYVHSCLGDVEFGMLMKKLASQR